MISKNRKIGNMTREMIKAKRKELKVVVKKQLKKINHRTKAYFQDFRSPSLENSSLIKKED